MQAYNPLRKQILGKMLDGQIISPVYIYLNFAKCRISFNECRTSK